MHNAYLYDSVILIDHLLGIPQAEIALDHGQDPLGYISVMTHIETLTGAKSADEDQRVRRFLKNFDQIELDNKITEETILVRKIYRLRTPDAVILATARVHGLTLVTRNTKDFKPDMGNLLIPYTLP